MQEIFVFLYEIYDEIHRKEEDDTKKFSENIDEIKKNKKNIINAIYISKILDNDDININDVKIHDNAIYLYDVIENIEEDNNKNIDEDFKKYNNDDFYIKKEEIEKKFNEIFKKKILILKIMKIKAYKIKILIQIKIKKKMIYFIFMTLYLT